MKISNKDIEYLLNDGNTPLHKSLISLIYSSGFDNDTIRELRVNDLIIACNHYFDDKSSKTLDELLKMDPDKIFPCWVFEKNKKVRVVFNSSEATKYLFSYLKDKKLYSSISNTDFLFTTYYKDKDKNGSPKQLDKDFISKVFSRKNKKLNEMTDQIRSFNANNLIFSFKKICEEHLELDEADKNELIDLFMGKATNDNKYYKMHKKDKNSILNYYKQVLPYLEINYHSNNGIVNSNDSYEKNTGQLMNDYYDVYQKIIWEYYEQHMQSSYDTMYGMDLKNWVYRRAKKYYDVKKLDNNTLYHLFKKAEVSKLLEGKNLYVHCSEDEWPKTLEILIEELGRLDLSSILGQDLFFILEGELNDYMYGTSFNPYIREFSFDCEKIIAAIFYFIDRYMFMTA